MYGNGADICYSLLTVTDEPKSYHEAIKSKDSEIWLKAMNEEYDSLIKNRTWLLVDPPENEEIIDIRWVYKIKEISDGTVDRCKARLVVRGFTECYGTNYTETFSPVVRFSSIRVILALAANRGMKIVQFDVKTAFLYGNAASGI